jgi:hypothetical protein
VTQPRISVFRISAVNATVLSTFYLLFATGIELVRRFSGVRWAERVSKSLELFPAGVLQFFGLFASVQRAWVNQELSDTQVRLIFGATVVAIVFALGLSVGTAMWAVNWVQRRRARV